MARDLALTRALRGNHGVITLADLRRIGYTNRQVDGLVEHGDLQRLHHGVYGDGRTALTDLGRLRAALLAVGAGAWMSGASAAVVWGMVAGVPARIDVRVYAQHTPGHPGLRVSRTTRRPHRSEVRTRRGLRVSSVPRLLIESAAAGADPEQLHQLIEHAVRRSLLDIPDLAATLQRNRGVPGARLVQSVCAAYLPHRDRKSSLERAFDRWLASHPELPPPQRNIRMGPWEIDCYWPAHGLALELDGRPYHTVIADIERDRRKDAWLQAHSKRIIRVTDARFQVDKAGIHRDLVRLLARAAGVSGTSALQR
ncbi:MAG: type IV toxin-antitoxin system AbiEi family antitoxin domain-containing protein [Solirubrobacteraceae bacterium]